LKQNILLAFSFAPRIVSCFAIIVSIVSMFLVCFHSAKLRKGEPALYT
jgi:hypothetical protein